MIGDVISPNKSKNQTLKSNVKTELKTRLKTASKFITSTTVDSNHFNIQNQSQATPLSSIMSKEANIKQKVAQIIRNKMEKSEPRILNNRQARFLRTASGVRTKNVYDTITNMTDASLIDYKIKLQSQINDLKVADIFDTQSRYTLLKSISIHDLHDSFIKSKEKSDCRIKISKRANARKEMLEKTKSVLTKHKK